MSAAQNLHSESQITTLYKNHVDAIELHFKKIYTRVTDQLFLLQESKKKSAKLVSEIRNYASIENDELREAIEGLAACIDNLDQQKQDLYDRVISRVYEKLGGYATVCKKAKDRVQVTEKIQNIAAHKDKERKEKEYKAAEAEVAKKRVEAISAEKEANKAEQELFMEIESFQRQKVRDLKSMCKEYIHAEMTYHAKCLELLTKAYTQFDSVSEEKEVKRWTSKNSLKANISIPEASSAPTTPATPSKTQSMFNLRSSFKSSEKKEAKQKLDLRSSAPATTDSSVDDPKPETEKKPTLSRAQSTPNIAQPASLTASQLAPFKAAEPSTPYQPPKSAPITKPATTSVTSTKPTQPTTTPVSKPTQPIQSTTQEKAKPAIPATAKPTPFVQSTQTKPTTDQKPNLNASLKQLEQNQQRAKQIVQADDDDDEEDDDKDFEEFVETDTNDEDDAFDNLLIKKPSSSLKNFSTTPIPPPKPQKVTSVQPKPTPQPPPRPHKAEEPEPIKKVAETKLQSWDSEDEEEEEEEEEEEDEEEEIKSVPSKGPTVVMSAPAKAPTVVMAGPAKADEEKSSDKKKSEDDELEIEELEEDWD